MVHTATLRLVRSARIWAIWRRDVLVLVIFEPGLGICKHGKSSGHVGSSRSSVLQDKVVML